MKESKETQVRPTRGGGTLENWNQRQEEEEPKYKIKQEVEMKHGQTLITNSTYQWQQTKPGSEEQNRHDCNLLDFKT